MKKNQKLSYIFIIVLLTIFTTTNVSAEEEIIFKIEKIPLIPVAINKKNNIVGYNRGRACLFSCSQWRIIKYYNNLTEINGINDNDNIIGKNGKKGVWLNEEGVKTEEYNNFIPQVINNNNEMGGHNPKTGIIMIKHGGQKKFIELDGTGNVYACTDTGKFCGQLNGQGFHFDFKTRRFILMDKRSVCTDIYKGEKDDIAIGYFKDPINSYNESFMLYALLTSTSWPYNDYWKFMYMPGKSFKCSNKFIIGYKANNIGTLLYKNTTPGTNPHRDYVPGILYKDINGNGYDDIYDFTPFEKIIDKKIKIEEIIDINEENLIICKKGKKNYVLIPKEKEVKTNPIVRVIMLLHEKSCKYN